MARRCTFAMTFPLPLELMAPEVQPVDCWLPFMSNVKAQNGTPHWGC